MDKHREIDERRKAEIAALPRKELNANVLLLEQEQEEYEREKRQLLDENRAQAKEIHVIRDRYRTAAAYLTCREKRDAYRKQVQAQAKEIERLEDELDDQRARANIAHRNAAAKSERMAELFIEIKQLREQRDAAVTVLEWYADKSTYNHHPSQTFSPIWADKGKRARQAAPLSTRKL